MKSTGQLIFPTMRASFLRADMIPIDGDHCFLPPPPPQLLL